MDTGELLNMMDSVDFSDPDQAAVALQVLSMVVGEEETTLPPFRNIFPTTTSSPIAEQEEAGDEAAENENITTKERTTSTTEEPTTTTGMDDRDAKDSEDFQGLINVMIKLTTSRNLPGNLSDDDFEKRLVSRGYLPWK